MKKPLKNTFFRKLLSLLMISTLFLSKGSLLMIQANEGSNNYDKDVQVLESWPGAVQQQSIMDNLAYGAHAESNMPTFKSDIDDHYVGKICDGIVNSTNHTQLDGNTVKTGDIWEITIDLGAENEFHLLAARFPNLNVALGKFTIKASADKENWDVISEVNSTPSKDVYVYLPEGATYRYIRLEKQFGANDKWSLNGEFEVYSKNTSNSDEITDFTGFPNYALKQKATMDKVNYPGHVPQNAADGNSGTYAQEESGKPFELTIEFADPTKLNVVRVKALESSRSINSFKLSYTEDGNNWVAITERETNSIERTSAIILEYLDAPVTAKQIKFEVLDATIWFAISSLEVFNTNKLRDLYTSPMPGQIKKGTTIELMTSDEDVTIYYSTDGSEPTLTSSTYTEPITVQEDTVIKAFAAKDGYENSNVASLIS